MSGFHHVTVLLDETVAFLAPRSGGVYVDCTLGGGGHAERILERSGPDGILIGIDRDPRALDAARARLAPFGDRVVFFHAEFADVRDVLARAGHPRVDGLVADVGVSSPQLDDATRGFSFSKEGPLDMRMDTTRGETAFELIGRMDEHDLADVLYELGEERKSRPVARAIKHAYDDGRLETTGDLAKAVYRVLGPKRGRIDPATRTFQALRIAVNRELDQLAALVEAIPELLVPGGVAAIISFHSLEDRIVKHAFRGHPRLAPLTKKPVIAGDAEAEANPRARSAKLRAVRLVEEGGDE